MSTNQRRVFTCPGPLVDSDHSDSVTVESHCPVGGQHLNQSRGPEPTIDTERLIVRSVTPIHLRITQSASSPDLGDPGALHQSLDELPLVRLLEGHQVHASLPAVVPRGEPVPLGVSQHLLITLPAEPVGLALELSGSSLTLSSGALPRFWQTNLQSSS